MYIDDRFVVSRRSDSENDKLVMMDANRLVCVLVELLTRLGYTLLLGKCSIVPSTCKKYLGFLVNSVTQAYILPGQETKVYSVKRINFG